MVEMWKKNKILFIIIVLLVVLFPSGIAKESLAYSHLICVSVGIDKVDSEFEVSLQVILPKQTGSFSENLKVVSAKGKSVAEAVDLLRYHTGKDVGFAQCEYIILNRGVCEENIIPLLDYFVKSHNINYNCILVYTEKSANKLLKLNGGLGESYSFDVGRILEYNEENLLANETNIEKVFQAYLSKASAFSLTVLNTSENSFDGIEGESSSGGSNGSAGGSSGGSSGGGDDKEKVISNTKKVALFKNGVLLKVVLWEDISGISYLSNDAQKVGIKVEDFTDDIFQNADIEFDLTKKKCSSSYGVVGDVLKIKTHTKLYLKVASINQNNFHKLLEKQKSYMTQPLIDRIKRQEVARVLKSVAKLKEMNCDIIFAFDNFNRFCHGDFVRFVDKLENFDDYFKSVEVDITFDIVDV